MNIVISLILFFLPVKFNCQSIYSPVLCGSTLYCDQAEVEFISDDANIDLYAINSQCYKCKRSQVLSGKIHKLLDNQNSSTCAHLFTPHQWTLQLIKNDIVLYSSDFTFGELGSYKIMAYNNSNSGYGMVIVEKMSPINSNEPLWILIGVIIAVIIASYAVPWLFEYIQKKRKDKIEDTSFLSASGITDELLSSTEQNIAGV